MSENNPVSDNMARRILRSISFTENFRGDNVRRTKDSVYIGSDGGEQAGVRNYPFAPRPFIVKEAKDEYLLCRPYQITDEVTGDKEVKIALPPHLRKAYNGEARTIWPGYVPDTTVVWAAHFRKNGAKDEDDKNIVLMDMNIDGRHTSLFPAKITAGTLDSGNQAQYSGTEQRRTSTGWEDLPDGRTFTAAINGMEANNAATGVQGNGIDLDGQIFTDNSGLEMKPVRGQPVVRLYVEVTADGTEVYTLHSANAIDGECE